MTEERQKWIEFFQDLLSNCLSQAASRRFASHPICADLTIRDVRRKWQTPAAEQMKVTGIDRIRGATHDDQFCGGPIVRNRLVA
jgi:hypothetical protein